MRRLAHNVIQGFMEKAINRRYAVVDDTGIVDRWCFEREMSGRFVSHVIDVGKKLTLGSSKG
jgi:hypothetical protein